MDSVVLGALGLGHFSFKSSEAVIRGPNNFNHNANKLVVLVVAVMADAE